MPITTRPSYTGARGVEGKPSTSNNCEVNTAINNSGVTIPYGRAVVITDPENDTITGISPNIRLVQTGDTVDSRLGITQYNERNMGVNTIDGAQWLDASGFRGDPTAYPVKVLRRGEQWAYTETAQTVNDPVFMRVATGASPNTNVGRFRADASAGCVDVSDKFEWASSSSVPGLTKLMFKGN
jgi:hypothetical protein